MIKLNGKIFENSFENLLETLRAKKDDSGDFYLVSTDEKDRLEKAGFQLEEARYFSRLQKLAGIK